MNAKLTKIEQETIIIFNELEQTAEVYTHNARLRRQLADVRETHPDEVTLKKADDACVTYTLPKAWVKVRPKRKATEAQLAAAHNALLSAKSRRGGGETQAQ